MRHHAEPGHKTVFIFEFVTVEQVYHDFQDTFQAGPENQDRISQEFDDFKVIFS